MHYIKCSVGCPVGGTESRIHFMTFKQSKHSDKIKTCPSL